ncbi:hypothetical protein PSHT_04471 [Puccinia striiformis]|uniref:Uncharacterized protein n=1 Tax=Puccinia striiformis TaxID=27350 RepID=A0A2S4WCS8_9BASI|nr:hypothetical protein PSHT_04471 [Puccinia striiformis]
MFLEASSFLQDQQFFCTETPIITFNDCEGAGEEALAASLGRVYSFGPTSRAKKSQTNCYLAEFWMLKAEILFIEDLKSLMNGLESLLKPIIWNLHQSNSLSS